MSEIVDIGKGIVSGVGDILGDNKFLTTVAVIGIAMYTAGAFSGAAAGVTGGEAAAAGAVGEAGVTGAAAGAGIGAEAAVAGEALGAGLGTETALGLDAGLLAGEGAAMTGGNAFEAALASGGTGATAGGATLASAVPSVTPGVAAGQGAGELVYGKPITHWQSIGMSQSQIADMAAKEAVSTGGGLLDGNWGLPATMVAGQALAGAATAEEAAKAREEEQRRYGRGSYYGRSRDGSTQVDLNLGKGLLDVQDDFFRNRQRRETVNPNRRKMVGR